MLGARLFSAVLAAWALALCLLAAPASGDYSGLEERTLELALDPKLERDDAPQGKRIESVEIRRMPVFDPDDPVPDWVNWVHAQSRESVIRREVLFAAGEAYDEARIAETIRNLQTIPQFGVVVIVAVKGSKPDSVRVVVVVRDVWSLRLNTALQGTLSTVSYLLINPTETNLFGTRTQLGAIFVLQPDRYALGGVAGHPRILGSKVDALGIVEVYTNLDSGETEGSLGRFALYQDFVALSDEWSFLAGGAWSIEQTRILKHGGVHIDYDPSWYWTGPVGAPSISNFRDPFLSHGVPIEYSTHIVRGGGQISRAFGEANKTVLTLGLELNRRKFRAARDPATSPEAFAAFVRDEVPVSDTRFGPFVQVEHRTTRFLATRDVETLELQESFSLGQIAALRVYPAAQQLGSSRDLLGTVSWLGYTWQLGKDGFVRGIGASSIEQADHARHQAQAQAALRVVAPKLGFARLVLDAAGVLNYRNYLNRKLALGGDTRPRGYVYGAFRGANAAAASLELRTSAINILSARIGGVAFYDVAAAADSVAAFKPHHSLGAGVRVLLPQINRTVFRLDWGAPLTPGLGREPDRPLPGGVYLSFGQAFDLPQLKLPQILGAETTLLEIAQ